MIIADMTSDPDQEARSRARLAELLVSAPPRVEDETTRRNRYAWHRASEQERRRMLKDCGWL
ncbi:MAG: hypothetical protein ABW128_08895 [Rhizorhabdus sp.]